MNRFTKTLLTSAALCAATFSPAQAELDVIKLKTAIESSVESDYPSLDTLYKDIHAHPEVAFQEVKTAAKLAAEMRELGFEVTEKIGKTGLAAIYKNGVAPPSWCAPNSTRSRWKRKPALPMQAATRPTGTGRTLLWRTAAATTFTWRAGSARRRHCSA
jgi:hippurate hydrolase